MKLELVVRCRVCREEIDTWPLEWDEADKDYDIATAVCEAAPDLNFCHKCPVNGEEDSQ